MFRTLKGKIRFIYFCLVLMIAIVGYVSAVNIYKLSNTIDTIMTNNYQSIYASNHMLEAIDGMDNAILSFINGETLQGRDEFIKHETSFQKWFDIEYNNITEYGERQKVDDVRKYFDMYLKRYSQLKGMSDHLDKANLMVFYAEDISPVFNSLKSRIKSLALLNEQAMIASKDKTAENMYASIQMILIITVIAFIGGFAISQYSSGKILNPIYALINTVKLVKAGDLEQRAEVSTNDEIGELALEFNRLTKRLKQYELQTKEKILLEQSKSISIVKGMSEPLMVLNKSNRIDLVNNAFAKTFNVSAGKVIGLDFSEVIRNKELSQYISEVQKSIDGHDERVILFKPNGEEQYFSVVVTKIRNNYDNITGSTIIFHDVTQFKQLDKMRTDFIATISHEFKTPLTSIMMGTSLILDKNIIQMDEKQRNIIEAIKDDGERLTNLVNELLDLAKFETAKSLFNFKECSISAIIKASVKLFSNQAEQKGVTIYNNEDLDLPEVMADHEKVTWVMNNLLANALKYTHSGDKIYVAADMDDNKLRISVKDTGVGIPYEYHDRVFDKFFQVKDCDLEVRGTGLGLYIVKEIIEAHGGTIWCESEPDKGSNFIFTLPLS